MGGDKMKEGKEGEGRERSVVVQEPAPRQMPPMYVAPKMVVPIKIEAGLEAHLHLVLFLPCLVQPDAAVTEAEASTETMAVMATWMTPPIWWRRAGGMKEIEFNLGTLCFFFSITTDCVHALCDRPWQILGNALAVQPWSSNFRASEDWLTHGIVWVQFADLAPSWYHPRILGALGSLVGCTIKIDIKTNTTERGQYAKVAIEVDLTRPFKGNVLFDKCLYNVSYEGLPKMCLSCGCIGNPVIACPLANTSASNASVGPPSSSIPPNSSSNPTKPNRPAVTTQGNSTIGDWMNATRPARRRICKRKRGDVENVNSPTTFTGLDYPALARVAPAHRIGPTKSQNSNKKKERKARDSEHTEVSGPADPSATNIGLTHVFASVKANGTMPSLSAVTLPTSSHPYNDSYYG
ncbi:hypothetical protein Tsubulata_033268 [Turnera subulata]|uniref:DUF4283 domain-containing protein n=1 Tax=Turnera subulata TaxID=218843 RepID=A0A9Q0FCD1_9ROSI|nr:hypothetical protein Tsubulata_033268 [Turnera subulata]